MTSLSAPATDWASIRRIARWYSGDIVDCLEQLGVSGHLPSISIQSALGPGQVVCGPAVTVEFRPSARRNQPQDVYHHAIDNTPEGSVIVVDASCAEGSCTGELMSSGAQRRGAVATVVGGSVRDISQVRAMGYPLFGRAISPKSVSGRMEPVAALGPIEIDGIAISPGDVIFGDADGVVVIPKALAPTIADLTDTLGAKEAVARDRILSGERLQVIWPVGSAYAG